jgi:hypothetical protein
MAVRTAALVGAVTGVAAIGALSGIGAGRLTEPAPAVIGSPAPLSSIPPPVKPSRHLPPIPDPSFPPAFDTKPTRYTWGEVAGPEKTLRVQIPKAWTDHIRLPGENEGRFREVREYNLRVIARPDVTSPAQARKDREAELHRNETADLKILSRESGTVTSRLDGTTRRYEELVYTFTDVQDRRKKLVLLRWVDRIELAAAGRMRDRTGLRAVLQRATETAELVPTESDKPN